MSSSRARAAATAAWTASAGRSTCARCVYCAGCAAHRNQTALPPAGHYDARATSWTWEKSKAGDTYLALIFSFTAPGEDGNDRT